MSRKMKDPQGLGKSGQAHPRCRAPQSKSTRPEQLDSLEGKELQQQEQEAEKQLSSLTRSWWLSDQPWLSARDRMAWHGTGQATQESIQVDLECLQRGRLYDLLGQSHPEPAV